MKTMRFELYFYFINKHIVYILSEKAEKNDSKREERQRQRDTTLQKTNACKNYWGSRTKKEYPQKTNPGDDTGT